MGRTPLLLRGALLLLCVSTFAVPLESATAQTPTGEWYQVGPWDAHIFSLAIDPVENQTMYAGTYRNGLYKSTNGGSTWSPSGLADLDVRCLAIDSVNTQTLYAYCTSDSGNALYKSIDGGNIWNKLASAGSGIECMVIDPNDSQIIYIGKGGSGVYKSIDGGVTWNPMNTGLTNSQIQILAMDPADSQTVYTGTHYGGVFKTEDGGASWSEINSGLEAVGMSSKRDVEAIAIDPNDPQTVYIGTWDGVYKSVVGGGSWSTASSGLNTSLIMSLAIDPANTSTIYAGSGNAGVFKSEDGASSWTAVNSGVGDLWVEAVVVNPSATETIYAATAHGAYKTTDGGNMWSSVNAGLGNRDIYSLAVNPADNGTIYAGTESDIYKSTDGGSTWSPGGMEAIQIACIAIAPSDSQILYAGAIDGVHRSTDGGTVWSPGLGPLEVNCVAVDPSTAETVYAGTAFGLHKSTDGGFWWDWLPLETFTGNDTFYALAIDPAQPQTIYAGADDGLYKSLDGGASWSLLKLGEPVLSIGIDSSNSQTIYIVSGATVIKSTNGGVDWSPLSFGLIDTYVFSLAIDTVNTQILYAGTMDGVYKSTNGGNSWSAINTGLEDLGVQSVALGPGATQTVYAGTWGSSVWRLDQSVCTVPEAFFGTDPPQGYVGDQFEFLDLSSGTIDTWYWNFGDGTTSAEQNPTHVFLSPDTYTVCLTVSGPCGTDTVCNSFSIEVRCEPLAKFTPSSTTAYAGEPITFTDESLGIIDTWQWYFGDPPFMGMSEEQNPTYTYIYPGSYYVCLEVSGPCGTSTECMEIVILPCTAPEAAPAADVPVGYIGDTIAFTDASTGTIDAWLWDFGDGTTSTEQNPSHQFLSRDMFDVCLTVSGPCGSDTACITVQIEIDCVQNPVVPEAAFTASATEVSVGESISFTNESSGIIDNMVWNFGDDPAGSTTEENPTHAYLEPGTYFVCLEVFGPCANDFKCLEITVHPPCTAPQAAFTPDANGVYIGDTISFSDESLGTIDTWTWEFGDGTTSAEQNPTHAYPSPSVYDVCLTVSGPCGSDALCMQITVQSPVSLTCAPRATSIIRGRRLVYTGTVTNADDVPVTFQYWTAVTLPNGESYPSSGALFGPVTVTLSPFETRSVTLTQPIPRNAPVGTYTYTCSVGQYPGLIFDECHFDFQVTRW